MRQIMDNEGNTDSSTQGHNKLAQEKGTFTLTNKEKIPPYSVVQSYVVEWQMQLSNFKK